MEDVKNILLFIYLDKLSCLKLYTYIQTSFLKGEIHITPGLSVGKRQHFHCITSWVEAHRNESKEDSLEIKNNWAKCHSPVLEILRMQTIQYNLTFKLQSMFDL